MRILFIAPPLSLLVAVAASASIAELLQVPPNVAASQQVNLARQRENVTAVRSGLIKKIAANNAKCDPEHDEATERQCQAERVQLTAEWKAYEDRVNQLKSAVKAGLLARKAEVEGEKAGNLQEINRFGFNRREQDFTEWVNLSEQSQKNFQTEVIKVATDVVTSEVKDRMLEGFRGFNQEKGERLIAWFERTAKQRDIPRPVETIAIIRRLSTFQPRDQLVKDAKTLLTAIDRTMKATDVKELREVMPFLLECVCDFVPEGPLHKQCEIFRGVSLFTAAALYNNAAQHVAQAEVERLSRLTEMQLKALDSRVCILHQQVAEIKAIDADLSSLERGATSFPSRFERRSCSATRTG